MAMIVIRKNNSDLENMSFNELFSYYMDECENMRQHNIPYSERRQHQTNATTASLMLKTRFDFIT